MVGAMSRQAMRREYIRAYCWHMGSHDSYYRDEVERADRDGAPADAVASRHGGGWHLYRDLLPTTREAVNRLYRQKTGHDLPGVTP